MAELKNCPFCNGEAKIIDSLICNDMKQVGCDGCGCLSLSLLTESALIKFWNLRAIDKKYQKAVEFVKKQADGGQCCESCISDEAEELLKEIREDE